MRNKLKTALEATGYSWAHYGWSHAPDGDYGTWGEERARDLEADDVHAETATICFVSYFTRDDSGEPRRAIERALNALRIPWKLSGIDYEEDTGYIHYSWYCTVLGEEADDDADGQS